ncbi:MAG: hypothetical protein COV47_06060 [Candidatus Diapherotrites archaeon CG11_big_fil_rev_8_21_14_0_20_37_9]|nr:MAG: hypothetical protein COV47_06060 [Candidatus Diapherotrites archaeon CG11_big_fil_rev_8_21_14_0_20_37_9]
MDKKNSKEVCEDCGQEECQCNDGCCGDDCCCTEPREMSKEEMDAFMTKIASDVWMKMYAEACEKEWKKVSGKQIQKLAARYVKQSKKEWDEESKKWK